MVLETLVCVAGMVGDVSAQPPVGPAPAKPVVVFPHPLITEVLYDVPGGKEGDADKDGVRSATGDEFVELFNPHDAPIQLAGYTISDGTPTDADKAKAKPDARPQIHFVFPTFELKPGQIVVVFNGFKQSIPGPVGDALHAPDAPNPGFAGAYVFTMKVASPYAAFTNKGDCVLLRDPKGAPVQAVRWGDPLPDAPAGTPLVEEAPAGIGSVQRVGLTSRLVIHTDLKPGVLYSPGEFDPKAEPPATAAAPPKTVRKAPPKSPPSAPTRQPGKGGG